MLSYFPYIEKKLKKYILETHIYIYNIKFKNELFV